MACATYFTPGQLRQWKAFDELEAKITELWGHLNAATYRFLTLVADFDREQAFKRHGLVNTAQWLNWQCGIGPVAAREKVRVARSLEQLPEIADAFAKGQISYSKVRAMTRVATPVNESVLVHVAHHGTAAHVEKLVRKYHWTQRRDAAKQAQRQHEQRSVSCFFDSDDEFVLTARLPREILGLDLPLGAHDLRIDQHLANRHGRPAETTEAGTPPFDAVSKSGTPGRHHRRQTVSSSSGVPGPGDWRFTMPLPRISGTSPIADRRRSASRMVSPARSGM
jgi:hypothetical protein